MLWFNEQLYGRTNRETTQTINNTTQLDKSTTHFTTQTTQNTTQSEENTTRSSTEGKQLRDKIEVVKELNLKFIYIENEK